MMIGSPHHLNSEFIFNTCSDHYLNITNTCLDFILHFCSLLEPPKLILETSDLFQTSEDYFGNFAPLPTFGYLWTIHPDHTHLP
jgi:hypothetical protein